MMLDIIALAALLISIIILALIIFRKFSIMATIDVKTVPQEMIERKKEDIIEMRLKRKWDWFRNKIIFFLKPIGRGLDRLFGKIYHKALELEKYYQDKAQPISDKGALNQQKVGALLTEGEELLKQEEYALAEKKFIQVISLDHRHIAAYDNLGTLYFLQKDYEHAIEALQHALKLNSQESNTHHDLGMVYKELGDYEKAILYLKKAVELDPNNPKYLDALLEVSILHKDKFLAEETFRKLKKANPENQKLIEIEKQIEEMRL